MRLLSLIPLSEVRGFTFLANPYGQFNGIRAAKVEDQQRSPQAVEYTERSACFCRWCVAPIAHGLAACRRLSTDVLRTCPSDRCDGRGQTPRYS